MQILAVIKKRGFRLEDVANALGITKGSLSATINGSPNVKKLIEIALVIGCSPAEFFGDWYENEGKAAQKPSQPAQQPAGESSSAEQQQADSAQTDGQQPEQEELPFDKQPAQEQHPQGTTLVGLVRCPQCGRAIRLYSE